MNDEMTGQGGQLSRAPGVSRPGAPYPVPAPAPALHSMCETDIPIGLIEAAYLMRSHCLILNNTHTPKFKSN